jgi:proteasome lid subunit RPN8/RPN11
MESPTAAPITGPELRELLGTHPRLYREMQLHALAEHPQEACGLIVRIRQGVVTPEGGALSTRAVVYLQAKNIHAQPAAHFELDPESWAFAEEHGEVLAVVHSHPDAACHPSDADRAQCAHHGLPWVILGGSEFDAFSVIEPTDWTCPLLEREFSHGILDCYSLVRDYYRQTLGIALPDFEREDAWWEKDEGAPGSNLYLDQFSQAGFLQVPFADLQPHDGLIMQVAARRPNHAAVYLGDGVILHHLYGQLSRRESFTEDWQRRVAMVVRHSSRIGQPQVQP